MANILHYQDSNFYIPIVLIPNFQPVRYPEDRLYLGTSETNKSLKTFIICITVFKVKLDIGYYY
ncbi:hypothetical protein BpHYR1_033405, partial [Brachionus plicatilis]